MATGKNGRPVVIPGGVPIIGQSVFMACSRGHVEKLAGPFQMQIPGPERGDPPQVLNLCRACWLNFVGMFGARPLTDEEIEDFRASGELADESPAPAVA